MSRRNVEGYKRCLSDKELEDIINNLSESEDGFDYSSDDSVTDPSFVPVVEENSEYNFSNETDEICVQEEDLSQNQVVVQEDHEKIINLEEKEHSSDQVNLADMKSKTKKPEIAWKKRNLILNETQLKFHGDTNLPADVLSLDTPFQFFCYFFTNNVIDKIVEETNLYSVQNNPNKPLNITALEVRQYIGICLYMSLVQISSCRAYWSDTLGFAPIRNTMSVNRFEKIREFMHFNDNSKHLPREHKDHDRLHKIRPLIDELNNNFAKIPLEQYLSIDEQMCSTKVRHFLKQYLPLKPHKWGFKLFVLSGVSGFAYRFEIYSGQENNADMRPVGEPDLGASANVVVRLCRMVPCNKNYQIYFDNYYTTIPLLSYLAKRGIYSLGTVRRNRIPNCTLPKDSDMKNLPRGSSFEYVGIYDDIDISSVIWKDNKIVTLLSTFSGELPVQTVKRFERKTKTTVNVNCPNVVLEYNRHMGGVDLLDSLLARHKILIKSKKWYFRLFYHMLDITVANSWLLYKKVNKEKNKTAQLTLAQFKTEIASCLCNFGKQNCINKRGRPSNNLQQQIETKKSKGPTQHMPPSDVRLDNLGHWPEWSANQRIRCKVPKCKGFTQTICVKCGVGLCYNKNNNCFLKFHTE